MASYTPPAKNAVDFDLTAFTPPTKVAVDFTLTDTPAGATGEIKVWLGSWIAKPIKVWTGGGWVVKPLKRWNGSTWNPTPY